MNTSPKPTNKADIKRKLDEKDLTTNYLSPPVGRC